MVKVSEKKSMLENFRAKVLNTRFNNNICKPQSKRSWGQHRFVWHAADDWNALPDGIRNFSDFLVFRRLIRNMKSLLSMLLFLPFFLDSYIYIFFFVFLR